MEVNEILRDIFHLSFPDQYELSSTFLRFQEHHDSAHFRGKFFSLEEFTDWYMEHSPLAKATGRFTYHEQWFGFNIPSHILDPFYAGRFDPLSDKEKLLLGEFEALRDKRFYLIGTHGEVSPDVLDHEIAHAFFYTRPDYKKAAMKIVCSVPVDVIARIHQGLLTWGCYHPDVLDDETHGYIMTGMEELARSGIDTNVLQAAHIQLNENYRAWFGCSKNS
ncbi:ABC transporter ATP-binding protein [Candidatus Woesearchaeota archaeon]|nr:ABC transporter ATP-binding protein [Candidatus Woesearchaeota archaeon]